MQNKASLYHSFLFFGLAIPIIVLSSVVYGGAAFWQVRIVYPAIFLLVFLALIPRIFNTAQFFCSKTSYYLFLSLSGFFLLGLLQFVFFLIGWPSVFETQSAPETYLAFPRVLAHILLFFYFYETFISRRRIRIFFSILIIITMILFYLGLSKSVLPPNWFPLTTVVPDTFASTFQYKNAFAFFVNLVYPFALATTLHESVLLTHSRSFTEAIKRLFLTSFSLKIIGLLLMVLAVVISKSKGGIITLMIVSLFTLFFIFLLELRKGRSRAFSFLVILIFLGLLSWCVFKLFGFYSPLKQTIEGVSYIFQQAAGFSASDRLMVIQTVLRAVSEHPLFGFGLGSFRDVFSHYQPASVWLYYMNAHNDYAELLFNAGYLGFILLLVIPVMLAMGRIIHAVRTLPRYSTDTLVLTIGILGGLLSAAIHSFSDFSLTYPASMFVFTALAGAFFALTENAGTLSTPQPRWGLRIVGLIIGAVLIILSFAAFETQLLSRQAYYRGKAELAHRLNPFTTEPYLEILQNSLVSKKIDSKTGLIVSSEIVRLSPNALNYYRLGKTWTESGYPLEGIVFLDKANFLAPAHRWYFFKNTLRAYCMALKLEENNPVRAKEYLSAIDRLVQSVSIFALDLSGAGCWELWSSTISDMVKGIVDNPDYQKKILEIIRTKYSLRCV